MTIAEKIKNMRKFLGLTQKELAEKCNLATGTIQQYELGKRKPSYEALQKIAVALSLPEQYFFINHTTEILCSDKLQDELLNSFDKLNDSGKGKAVEQVGMLTKIPEYQKEDSSSTSAAAEHSEEQ